MFEKGIIKVTISHQNTTKDYIGSTCVPFKTRYNHHKLSFNSNKSTQTLFAYIKKQSRLQQYSMEHYVQNVGNPFKNQSVYNM